MTDRAQSEVIGFVLVFSLIVASTGIVYVAGFSSLEDARTAEQLNNVERAFDILDDNMYDLSRRGAPTRSTEVDLAGGALRLDTPVNVTVEAENTTSGATTTITTSSRPIVFEKDDRQVVYAYGATLRQNGEDSVMVADPGWVVGDRRTLLPLIVTQAAAGGRTAVGGETTVLLRARADSRGVRSSTVDTDSSTELTVTVESPRAEAWGQFAERRGFTVVGDDGSDGDVTFQTTTDGVVIQLTTTSVNFDL